MEPPVPAVVPRERRRLFITPVHGSVAESSMRLRLGYSHSLARDPNRQRVPCAWKIDSNGFGRIGIIQYI